METVILHISDLHVTLHTKSNGKKASGINSFLTTDADETSSNHFIDTFVTHVLKEYPDKRFILTITGDISNLADKKEFEFSQKFIRKIVYALNISPKDCLLLPGDHDIHRRSIDNELEIRPNSSPHLLHEIKLKNFSELYKHIKETDFPFGKLIIDYIVIEDKIVLLGINSNYKIDNDGGEGYIPIDAFRIELESLKAELNNTNLHYIACWHHNFTAAHEDTNRGQWESENRKILLAELERQNIKLVFTGNEHTSSCKTLFLGLITTSDCGALSVVKDDAFFKAYPIKINGDIVLENKIYGLVKGGGNDTTYFWNTIDNNSAKQPYFFKLFVVNNQEIPEPIDLPHAIKENKSDQPLDTNTKERIFYNNVDFSEKLYSIIKEKKLFHTGHFHWSETSRAHNWIDISKLLEDAEDLYFAQNAIIDIIKTFELDKNCDLIIGLGYEGNIISTKASIKFNAPYTSLPYSYRYKDHNEYEKKLNYENSNGKYKTVIIITDVVNDGRTIRKLISKREKDFFDNVERIIVLSLFYTGYQEINTDILNWNNLPENYDFDNDHEVNNIEFYTVKPLRVEKCPYGKNYREECFIYKDELSCVHLFYTED